MPSSVSDQFAAIVHLASRAQASAIVREELGVDALDCDAVQRARDEIAEIVVGMVARSRRVGVTEYFERARVDLQRAADTFEVPQPVSQSFADILQRQHDFQSAERSKGGAPCSMP